MSLKTTIINAIKSSMKQRDKSRVAALRLIKADIQRFEVDQRITDADDNAVLDILSKMLKQRRDSHQQYLDADRQELAAQEAYEIDIIKTFLPKPLTETEISALINQAITDADASSMKDMGAVMAQLKPKLQGRADMAQVSALVRQHLS